MPPAFAILSRSGIAQRCSIRATAAAVPSGIASLRYQTASSSKTWPSSSSAAPATAPLSTPSSPSAPKPTSAPTIAPNCSAASWSRSLACRTSISPSSFFLTRRRSIRRAMSLPLSLASSSRISPVKLGSSKPTTSICTGPSVSPSSVCVGVLIGPGGSSAFGPRTRRPSARPGRGAGRASEAVRSSCPRSRPPAGRSLVELRARPSAHHGTRPPRDLRDLLAGVVARAADHRCAHEWAPPSKHRVDLLSLYARADGLLPVQGVLQLVLCVFRERRLQHRAAELAHRGDRLVRRRLFEDQEERRSSGLEHLADLILKVPVDSGFLELAHQSAHSRADCHTENRDEEEDPEEKSPEHAVARAGAHHVVARRDPELAVLVSNDRRDRVGLDDQLVREMMGLLFGLGCGRLVGVPDCNQFGHSVVLSFAGRCDAGCRDPGLGAIVPMG